MSQTVIDLRSDTITRPTPGMRAAMNSAEVGDDVFHEDPTINRLEERVASLLGKEAALFVPSGSMSNQIGVKVHTQPGDELLCDVDCHIYNYEAGGPAALGGLLIGLVETFVNGTRLSTYKDAIAFAILIGILLFRPAGLLGRARIEKV